MDAEAIAQLEEQGMTVTYPEKQEFIDAASDLYTNWENQFGDVISEIRALSTEE